MRNFKKYILITTVALLSLTFLHCKPKRRPVHATDFVTQDSTKKDSVTTTKKEPKKIKYLRSSIPKKKNEQDNPFVRPVVIGVSDELSLEEKHIKIQATLVYIQNNKKMKTTVNYKGTFLKENPDWRAPLKSEDSSTPWLYSQAICIDMKTCHIGWVDFFVKYKNELILIGQFNLNKNSSETNPDLEGIQFNSKTNNIAPTDIDPDYQIIKEGSEEEDFNSDSATILQAFPTSTPIDDTDQVNDLVDSEINMVIDNPEPSVTTNSNEQDLKPIDTDATDTDKTILPSMESQNSQTAPQLSTPTPQEDIEPESPDSETTEPNTDVPSSHNTLHTPPPKNENEQKREIAPHQIYPPEKAQPTTSTDKDLNPLQLTPKFENGGHSYGTFQFGGMVKSENSIPLDSHIHGCLKVTDQSVHDKKNYASGYLRNFIIDISQMFCDEFPQYSDTVLLLNAISNKSGGKIGKHVSHQNGLDLDMAYISSKPNFKPAITIGDGQLEKGFDLKRNWEFFKLLERQKKYEVIKLFVWPTIKKYFCKHAASLNRPLSRNEKRTLSLLRTTESKKILNKDGSFKKWTHPHIDHVHMRLQCPVEYRGKDKGGPSINDRGCAPDKKIYKFQYKQTGCKHFGYDLD